MQNKFPILCGGTVSLLNTRCECLTVVKLDIVAERKKNTESSSKKAFSSHSFSCAALKLRHSVYVTVWVCRFYFNLLRQVLVAFQQSDIIVSSVTQWSSLLRRHNDGHCLCMTAVSFLRKKKCLRSFFKGPVCIKRGKAEGSCSDSELRI